MEKILQFITNFDPATLQDMSPEQLAETYKMLSDVIGVMTKIKSETGQVLLTQFEGNGMVFGQWGVTRVATPSYSGVSMDQARELGAIKEAVDTTKLGALIKKGVEVAGVKYSFYPKVTNMNAAGEEEAE